MCLNFLYSVDFIIISYHTLTTLLPHFFPISSSLKHSETTYSRKRKKPQNQVNTRFSRLFHKQGMRESNSRQRFWRPVYVSLQPLQTHEKTLTINNFTTVLPHFMKLMYLTDLLRYVYPNQMV